MSRRQWAELGSQPNRTKWIESIHLLRRSLHCQVMTEEECAPQRALRRDAERNRQRIVAAARELFAVRGLEATLNDVAHHANVGVGTVYRRFATKEELLEAIFEDGIDQVACLAETGLQHKDSWDGFVWFVEQLCELTATDRGLCEMVYSKAYGGYRVECARLRLTPSITELVERARKDGHLRPDIEPSDMPSSACSQAPSANGPATWTPSCGAGT